VKLAIRQRRRTTRNSATAAMSGTITGTSALLEPTSDQSFQNGVR
jgi:hypothetical protein